MTIADLLCYLREQLLIVINLFLESAYESHDKSVASMLEAMGDSIRDSFMGVEWKSEIPTIEAIKALNNKTSVE
jgi:hypothetical protein